MKFELDATNESYGRLASKAAAMLRGKHLASYTPNKMADLEIVIKNLDKIKFTGNKMSQKVYYHYSGYHSGMRTRKLSELWASRPEYVFRRSVYTMLPKNKLRDKVIKKLKFK